MPFSRSIELFIVYLFSLFCETITEPADSIILEQVMDCLDDFFYTEGRASADLLFPLENL